MTRCLIALGGNINASEAVFREAMQRLERPGLVVEQLSRPFVTRPVGSAAGEEYVNAAAVLKCTLAPMSLLKTLHEVEDGFGRERTIHWGPRTLDLDLCLFGDEVIESESLVVPHPAMWYRRFVLDPAVEVAGSMRHPILGQTMDELKSDAMARPLRVEMSSDTHSDDELLFVVQTLRAEGDGLRGVDILLSAQSLPLNSTMFARLIIETTQSDARARRQPANELCRQVRFRCASMEDLEQQMQQFFVAALG
ncbi:MAG: 2-amino-4-hydroxy-6-hydroxymethyldihydropteridine diphosphokinase [Planctomycetaceae bacterium]